MKIKFNSKIAVELYIHPVGLGGQVFQMLPHEQLTINNLEQFGDEIEIVIEKMFNYIETIKELAKED